MGRWSDYSDAGWTFEAWAARRAAPRRVLGELRAPRTGADLVFELADGTARAHCAVVRKCSDAWAGMLRSKAALPGAARLCLPEVRLCEMRVLLRLVYTGQVGGPTFRKKRKKGIGEKGGKGNGTEGTGNTARSAGGAAAPALAQRAPSVRSISSKPSATDDARSDTGGVPRRRQGEQQSDVAAMGRISALRYQCRGFRQQQFGEWLALEGRMQVDSEQS